jgi:hydrogenase nickel incorporation protein HypB
MEVKVLRDILDANDQIAIRNRRLLDEKNIFAVNVMASPGSGKTSLILATIQELRDKIKIGVIEGDISSTRDADLVATEGVPVVQINTSGSCHLDANMIENGLRNLPLDHIDLLLVENVGNLVCPAEFAIGENIKVLVSSVPEGDDKPYKYPLMFTEVDIIVLNKMDLLPYVKFDTAAFEEAVRSLNQDVTLLSLSCATGEGVQEWTNWLLRRMATDRRADQKQHRPAAPRGKGEVQK